ncbi:aldehyde dehydrogenase family protein [Zhongshania sp.]|uniref:aldehyde dehydrogenase family protein n=1 Tax=Zhongshania sp. TaxID=1971902 RepID=UPI001B7930DB|nr:aldehyde dehydrogenase family protein [Zhongshania sp.]MBQ0795200.1 aldehyde dehydrogenase family protein [Zhongshania sp.]
MMNTSVVEVDIAKTETPSPAMILCSNPANGHALGQVAALSASEVDAAVESAHRAQKAWAKSSFKQRRAVLQHILDYLLNNADELCDYIVQDSGKTYENALLGEIFAACNKLKWLIKNGERHLRSEKVSSGLLMHKKGRIEYRPLGVVACIVPWNYPLQNIISSLGAPLMAGNAVIIKASEMVAWSSSKFQEITNQALEKEGFSSDTVQIINGYGDTGAALVRSNIQKILFIGSVGNGRRIIEGSAKNIVPVVMELGGKDPLIVCEDANLDKAVHSALGGNFINLGQNCIASERIIVHDKVYKAFLEQVSTVACALRQGPPQKDGNVDVGAMTSPLQVAIVDKLVKDAIAKGARVICGGAINEDLQGNYYPPTILADVSPDMAISYEEVFGPVMLIMRVSSDEEAIALANSTDFGLHSSVITKSRRRGEKIADQLEAGATCINDFGLCYLNQDLPFGGVKYSGFGRMNGRDGLRAYTNQKAVLSDRFPFEIPPKLFPVGASDYDVALASTRMMFSNGLIQKLKHLCKLISLSLKKNG